ncbi:MAG: hypothetical protein U0S12_06380 [Fimbriimonadales bacterium]
MANGEVLLDTRAIGMSLDAGFSMWSPPLGPHTLENVGEGPIHIISVEVKPS